MGHMSWSLALWIIAYLEKASITITRLQDREGCLHRMCSLQAHKDCVSQYQVVANMES